MRKRSHKEKKAIHAKKRKGHDFNVTSNGSTKTKSRSKDYGDIF